jgi:UDP-2-acetamido-3-amino-2,3-dideoxy-glucuronate N-acetyltransferase
MRLIAPSAEVDAAASVGAGTAVWQLAQIREGAVIGRDCVIGRGVYVGPGVRVGDRVKIQNHALIYEPAVVEGSVFVGPAAILTNDRHPRAVSELGLLKSADDWTQVGVHVCEGASLGARSVCLAPVRIGKWSMVGAGAVVTRDVPDFALVVGVPARQIGWVDRAGDRLIKAEADKWDSPGSSATFVESEHGLIEAVQS